MIRPLKISFNSYKKLGPVYTVKTHKHEILVTHIKFRKESFEKLLSYPITAFGYDLTTARLPVDINPKFSKHDVIRALDFWIEHWVYQNQLEAAFTDTVNVDHEITLKELILVRESIMKMPADTKFTRERIKEPEVDNSKGGHNFNFEVPRDGIRKFYHYDGDDDRVITNMTEKEVINMEQEIGKIFPRKGHYKKPKLPDKKKIIFTQAVYCEDSSLDPFCHRVLELTPEEYIKYKNGILYLPNSTTKDIQELQRALSRGATTAIQGIIDSFANVSESIRNAAMFPSPLTVSAPWTTIGGPVRAQERFQRGDVVVWDARINGFRIATSEDENTIRLDPDIQTEEFIRWVTTGTFVVPEGTHLIMGDTLGINNDSRDIRMVDAEVAEPINPGDIIHLDGNGQWRKVPPPRFGERAFQDLQDVVNHAGTLPLGGNIRINGTDIQTGTTGIDPGFEVMSVPVEARSFTIDDTTVEDDEIHTGPDHLLHSNLHPGIPTEEPQAIGILGEPGMISNIVGAAGEQLHIGDRIYMDNNNARWYKATPFGPAASQISIRPNTGIGEIVEAVREATVIYPPNTTPTLYPGDTLLGQNLTDNVMVRRRLRNNTSSTDTITYVNMRSVVNGQPVMEDPNTFVVIPVSFSGNGAEINADVFLQSGDMIDKLTSWNNHRIQIRPGQRNFLEIDGEEYHCSSMRISHNPSTPLSGMIFRDLIKISAETTVGRIVSMEVNFDAYIGITQCEIYLKIDNPNGGRLMDNRSFRQWDLEILGNNRVRIGEDDFTVTEPIQINMR